MALLSTDRYQIRRCVALALLAWASSIYLAAQTQSKSQGKQRRTSVQETFRTAQATRVDHAPRLDGTLDDPLWQLAPPIDNFLQREPSEGQPPTEKTEVRILYSKHEVYFGIRCFDSDPNGIFATELRRDVSQELDDYFEIVIDSSHDRRNAYVFQINPLGTQRDALITEATDAMLYYAYSVRGVQYEASQDLNGLRHLLPTEPERLIGPASLKYSSKNPGNSILICEEWSGLRLPSRAA